MNYSHYFKHYSGPVPSTKYHRSITGRGNQPMSQLQETDPTDVQQKMYPAKPMATSHRLPLVPIVDAVLFPGIQIPLSLGRGRSIAAVEAADLSEQKQFIVTSQKNNNIPNPTATVLFTVGVLASISKIVRTGESVEVFLRTSERVQIHSLTEQPTYLEAEYTILQPLDTTDPQLEAEALLRIVIEQGKLNQDRVDKTDYPGKLYFIGFELHLPFAKQQMLLQVDTSIQGLTLIHEHQQRETQVADVQKRILGQAKGDLDRVLHDQLLRQELANIQQELGDSYQGDLNPLKLRLQQVVMPPLAQQEAKRQMGQLEILAPSSAEYSVGRSYLELLVELPWVEQTTDRLDLAAARTVLDEAHYGLKKVKERILEFLAVMRLNPTAHAPILCFVGPPGTGKTSLGESIARAIGRKFERLSLGGMHDEAELRGHRRTYVGAMTGRLIQAIRRSKVNNPLMMLDEVDKLRQSVEGDPAAALLEVLDPAQNHQFHDNYLDVPFDLSKVFFITTANNLENIPSPLLDRMEVIRLSGYSPDEKLEIGLRHLVPRLIKEAGMTDHNLLLPANTLTALISGYTSEAGVRQFERAIARLIRRIALRMTEQDILPGTILPEQLDELLGGDEVPHTITRKQLSAGVGVGLAYTEAGGEVLYVEATHLPPGEPLELTGSLGDVLKESARAARTYLMGHPNWLGLPPGETVPSMHIHIPAGSTPKDGPSAGLAMICAMLSACNGIPARADIAMTGEITLTGLVLPVGGIKEKMLCAHRSGIRRVILPSRNHRNLDDLPAAMRAEMEFILVDRVEDALPHVFENWAPTNSDQPHGG